MQPGPTNNTISNYMLYILYIVLKGGFDGLWVPSDGLNSFGAQGFVYIYLYIYSRN